MKKNKVCPLLLFFVSSTRYLARVRLFFPKGDPGRRFSHIHFKSGCGTEGSGICSPPDILPVESNECAPGSACARTKIVADAFDRLLDPMTKPIMGAFTMGYDSLHVRSKQVRCTGEVGCLCTDSGDDARDSITRTTPVPVPSVAGR